MTFEPPKIKPGKARFISFVLKHPCALFFLLAWQSASPVLAQLGQSDWQLPSGSPAMRSEAGEFQTPSIGAEIKKGDNLEVGASDRGTIDGAAVLTQPASPECGQVALTGVAANQNHSTPSGGIGDLSNQLAPTMMMLMQAIPPGGFQIPRFAVPGRGRVVQSWASTTVVRDQNGNVVSVHTNQPNAAVLAGKRLEYQVGRTISRTVQQASQQALSRAIFR